MAMTRRQIDASREKRLWISQVIIPSRKMEANARAIPEVRETVKAKANEIRFKIESRMKK